MSSVRVQAIEALNELRTALLRFKNEAQDSLQAALAEIKRTRALLDERLYRWQSELQRRFNQLQDAEAAYRSCVNSARYDPATGRGYQPDCSGFEVAVRTARRRVEEAQQNIRIIQVQIRTVEDASARYQRQAAQFSQMLDTEISKASTQLGNQLTILTEYASGWSGGTSSGGGGSGQPTASPPVNSKGHPYPTVLDPRTGAPIHFPSGPLARVDQEDRVLWTTSKRDAFTLQWEQRGYPVPEGGWDAHHIHHILPREFGGTNDFWNLVPLTPEQHNGSAPEGFTAWWNAYFLDKPV